MRRGQGDSLHVTATPQIHRTLLHAADALDSEASSPADRKAYRIYRDRVDNVSR